MEIEITTQISKQNIDIRLGTLDDINGLVELNNKWYKSNLNDINNGFLAVRYSADFFEKIVLNKDLLVFAYKNEIKGYVLVNTVIETNRLTLVKEQYIINRGQCENRNCAFGYQILLDKPLQGTSFFYEAQKYYFNYYKIRFSALISTVSKENIRSIKAHSKANWTFINTEHDYFIIEQQLQTIKI